MTRYIVEHLPHVGAFYLYKKAWLFGIKDPIKGFYYPTDASVEQMRRSKQEAFDYIKILKELDDTSPH